MTEPGDLGELWLGGPEPGSLSADAVQRAIESMRAQLDALAGGRMREAAGRVASAGGSSYALVAGVGGAQITGIATGQCRITLRGGARSTNHVWPVASVEDNGAWCESCVVVSASPVSFDVYTFSPGGVATARSFFFRCGYVPER